MFVRRLYKLTFGKCTLLLGPSKLIKCMGVFKYLYRDPVNEKLLCSCVACINSFLENALCFRDLVNLEFSGRIQIFISEPCKLKALTFVRRLYKLIFGECTSFLVPSKFSTLMYVFKYFLYEPCK